MVVERLSRFVFGEYMQGLKAFDAAIEAKLEVAYCVLSKEIPFFEDSIQFDGSYDDNGSMIQKIGFMASWVITWFCYKINSREKIYRIFDFILCSLFPYAVSYVAAAALIILFGENKISEDSDVYSRVKLADESDGFGVQFQIGLFGRGRPTRQGLPFDE